MIERSERVHGSSVNGKQRIRSCAAPACSHTSNDLLGLTEWPHARANTPGLDALPLQAQCILFARNPEVLAPFKYAGYPMLLDAVTLPESGGGSYFLGTDRAPQLQVRN